MLAENDIMEELSLAFVRAIASRASFSLEEVGRDRDSIDLHILGRGSIDGGALHSPVLAVQLKSIGLSPEQHEQYLQESSFPFDLKLKNYEDLRAHTLIPRVLVVFLMPKDPQLWLTSTPEALTLRRAAYWCSLRGNPATHNTSSVRVRLPWAQIFDVPGVRALLARISHQEDLRP